MADVSRVRCGHATGPPPPSILSVSSPIWPSTGPETVSWSPIVAGVLLRADFAARRAPLPSAATQPHGRVNMGGGQHAVPCPKFNTFPFGSGRRSSRASRLPGRHALLSGGCGSDGRAGRAASAARHSAPYRHRHDRKSSRPNCALLPPTHVPFPVPCVWVISCVTDTCLQ